MHEINIYTFCGMGNLEDQANLVVGVIPCDHADQITNPTIKMLIRIALCVRAFIKMSVRLF